MAILLPDLLENGYKLPDDFKNSSAWKSLKDFQDSLKQLDITEITDDQVGMAVLLASNGIHQLLIF